MAYGQLQINWMLTDKIVTIIAFYLFDKKNSPDIESGIEIFLERKVVELDL